MAIKHMRREVVQAHVAEFLDAKMFTSAEEFGNPEKFWGALATEQSDVILIKAVLTEEGRNNNGHFFRQGLLIKTFASARLKPTNVGHNKTEIIGVIYDSALANDKNEIISPEDIDVKSDGTPYYKGEGKLRIVVAIAMWNMIGRSEPNAIAEAVKNGDRVDMSMECWFQDWKYRLVGKDGSIEYIPASTESNYLMDYVGKTFGSKDVTIDFADDGFVWGGIGQVKKGACPESVITEIISAQANDITVDGPSAFRNFPSITKEVSEVENSPAPTEEQTETEHLSNVSANQEGDTSMKYKRDKDGNLVLDAQGNPILEIEASEGAEGSELTQLIISQAQTIARLEDKVASLEQTAADATAKVAEVQAELDAVKASQNEAVEAAKAEVAAAKKEAKVANYLLIIAREHKDLVIEDEDALRTMIASDDFTDDKFNAFVKEQTEKATAVAEEKKKIARQAKCEILGLSVDASDEDIQAAEAKYRAAIIAAAETPEEPVQSDTAKAGAAAAQGISGVTASAAGSGFKKGSFSITVVETETGRSQELK